MNPKLKLLVHPDDSVVLIVGDQEYRGFLDGGNVRWHNEPRNGIGETLSVFAYIARTCTAPKEKVR